MGGRPGGPGDDDARRKGPRFQGHHGQAARVPGRVQDIHRHRADLCHRLHRLLYPGAKNVGQCDDQTIPGRGGAGLPATVRIDFGYIGNILLSWPCCI